MGDEPWLYRKVFTPRQSGHVNGLKVARRDRLEWDFAYCAGLVLLGDNRITVFISQICLSPMAFDPLRFVQIRAIKKPREVQVAEAAYFLASKRGCATSAC